MDPEPTPGPPTSADAPAPTGEVVPTAGGRAIPADGLNATEVAARQRDHGPNRLAEAPRRSPLAVLIDQFRNLLIIILLGAAVLAGVVGDLADTVVIGVVLLINAVLGFVQEHRAEASLDALRSMLVATARVRRDGRIQEIPSEELVPGDVILLEAGDKVPADARLGGVYSLEIDESTLTGESTAVVKELDGPSEGGPLAERTGAAFMNTTVTRGRGEAEVTAIGMATEVGAVAGMLQRATTAQTPLQRQLDVLGKRLALVAAGAVALFIALELGRGSDLGDTLLGAVALAVAAIPEGLPAVVTVTLAVGTHQMAKRGAIVKRLASVETLGATSVICSDKTGTLTLNQMTARVLLVDGRRHDLDGEGYATAGEVTPAPDEAARDAALVAALCSDAVVRDGELVGDPTEGALVVLAEKVGVDVDTVRRDRPRTVELPFDSATKLMATGHATDDGDTLVLVKGALDVVLERTDLDEGERARHLAVMEGLAADGLRVLALARRVIPGELSVSDDLADHLSHLELVGVAGLLDPPRTEARDAIRLCRRAGVAVKMITGDHAATAEAIARQLGIEGEVITGARLDELSDDELRERVDGIGVVSRVSPQHKVRMVRLLKERGHVVAMTGDGVNDAPALKSADIGVAMGITGTEVTKEAAAMVLTDDNFATIVGAVERGRTIYSNIVTFVRFQLSTNLGAIFTLLAAPLLGLPVPFSAIQILWVNIIMDGPPAMALGVDPPRPGAMDEPPRDPAERILTARRLEVLISSGVVMAIGTLSVLQLASDTKARTLAFTTFVAFQLFNALNARTERASIRRRSTFANAKLWLALAVVAVLQVLVVHLGGLQGLFDTVGLDLVDWLIAIGVASSIVWVEETRKAVLRRRAGPDRAVRAQG
ncbi:cation-translocating P-type ATPase [soil metagenome]